MARKMTLKELISFEEMLLQEELSAKEVESDTAPSGQHAYLLNELLFSGKARKGPQ
ncbi:MAG: hypothetical protein HY893_01355 [Deltaproteobacteria bacterium]|nr:hypothetical protein [Deltaproteobacteria bacterium]